MPSRDKESKVGGIFRNQLIQEFIEHRITFLGAGPMSPISVSAIINLANKYKKPIALIPTRRQVEAASLGGGYSNNWTTEAFAKFVRERDLGGFAKLSRDHSGPWQLQERNELGDVLSHDQAMTEVKESLSVDLKCGFDLLHLDPSKGLSFGRTQNQVEDDIYELLDYCVSKSKGQFEFEIGADDQSYVPDLVTQAEENLSRVLNQIKKLGLPAPLFYVLQTGTKVMEMRNVGSFDAKLPVEGMLPSSVQVPEMLKMCMRHDVFLKEHNADYISTTGLKWHRRFGIHAANVAPEFGVAETLALLEIAEINSEDRFISDFSNKVLKGEKWKKWLVSDGNCTDSDKIKIAGHYHFSELEIITLREKLGRDLRGKGIDLEDFVQTRVEESIDRYLRWFGYVD